MNRSRVPRIFLVVTLVAFGASCQRSHASTRAHATSAQPGAAAVPSSQGDPSATFWKWFIANQSRLFTFERDRERVFKDLTQALDRVNPDLTFEFGPVKKGRREFVISAGGIRTAFPAVRHLVAVAPPLPRWHVIAFRPRRAKLADLTLGGTEVKVGNVHFRAGPDRDRVGITLLIRGYRHTPQKTYEQIGYLFLDEALGEYVVETRVGYVSIKAPTPGLLRGAHPLDQLAPTVDHWDGGT